MTVQDELVSSWLLLRTSRFWPTRRFWVLRRMTKTKGLWSWRDPRRSRLFRAVILAGFGVVGIGFAVHWYHETGTKPLRQPAAISINLTGPRIYQTTVSLKHSSVGVLVHTKEQAAPVTGNITIGRGSSQRLSIVINDDPSCLQEVGYLVQLSHWGCTTFPAPLGTIFGWTRNPQRADAYLPEVTVNSGPSNTTVMLNTYFWDFNGADNYTWTTSPIPTVGPATTLQWTEAIPSDGPGTTTWQSPLFGLITATNQAAERAATRDAFLSGAAAGVGGGFFTAAVVALLETRRTSSDTSERNGNAA